MSLKAESEKLLKEINDNELSIKEDVKKIASMLIAINQKNEEIKKHLQDRSKPHIINLIERTDKAKKRNIQLTEILIYQVLGINFTKEEIHALLNKSLIT